jgi:hypothetical protein
VQAERNETKQVRVLYSSICSLSCIIVYI